MEERAESRGLSRAGLLKAGTALAVAAGLGGAGRALAGGAGAVAVGTGLGKPSGGAAFLRRRTYVPLLGSHFRITPPGSRALRLKLIEAEALPGPGESFSLIFRGRVDPELGSGIFGVEHPALGHFDLFLGPVGRGVKGLDLQAIINRIAL
jgi:hypothetical protein